MAGRGDRASSGQRAGEAELDRVGVAEPGGLDGSDLVKFASLVFTPPPLKGTRGGNARALNAEYG